MVGMKYIFRITPVLIVLPLPYLHGFIRAHYIVMEMPMLLLEGFKMDIIIQMVKHGDSRLDKILA